MPVSIQESIGLESQWPAFFSPIMASEPSLVLPELLSGFPQEFTETMSQYAQRLRTELQDLHTALDRQLDQRLSSVEKTLSGPLSHSLPWDWVPDSAECQDLEEFMEKRRLRYRGDPCYIVTAREYYAKYCSAQVDILKELQSQGHFYAPPSTRLFAKFGREVVDGKKRIFHERDIRKSGIPQEQIDLAWTTEGLTAAQEFQDYFPQGPPITRPEKEYFLDVIHTLRGVKYTPILPISDTEQVEMESFRLQLNDYIGYLRQYDEDRSMLTACTGDLAILSEASHTDWQGSRDALEHCQKETKAQLETLERELEALETEVEAKRKIEESMRKQESETRGEISRLMETDYNESVFEDIAADSG